VKITEINATNFNAAVAALSDISGASIEKALRVQTAKVLAACIRYTPERSEKQILKSVATRNSRIEIKGGPKLTFNVGEGSENRGWLMDESTWGQCNWGKGKKSNVQGSTQPPRKVNAGRSLHEISANRHWSNKRWATLNRMMTLLQASKISPEVALKSKGLTKATWYQIVSALAMEGEVSGIPKRLKNVGTFSGNPAPQVGSGRSEIEANGAKIVISNASRVLTKSKSVNGWAILQRAMDARLSAFKNELKQGVFDDPVKRAKRYPGIF